MLDPSEPVLQTMRLSSSYNHMYLTCPFAYQPWSLLAPVPPLKGAVCWVELSDLTSSYMIKASTLAPGY